MPYPRGRILVRSGGLLPKLVSVRSFVQPWLHKKRGRLRPLRGAQTYVVNRTPPPFGVSRFL